MRENWKQFMDRYDALTLRERVMVAVGLIAATAFLFHFLLLDPLLVKRQRLTREVAQARAELRTAGNLVTAQETQTDPDAVRRAYREALRKQLAEIDQGMQGMQKGLVPPEQMPKLLEGVLAHNRRLQLVSLRKLPVQRFEADGTAGPKPKAAAAAKGEKTAAPAPGQPDRSIYQHTFEVTVQGSYADLHDYLARLEKLPWQMFWGRMSLNVDQYPRLTLTLTVHTLSLSKAWLIV